MLRASTPSVLLDYFRVPYAVDPGLRRPAGMEVIEADGRARLLWPAVAATGADPSLWRFGEMTLYAAVAPQPELQRTLEREGSGWQPSERLCSRSGDREASVWRCDDGSVALPFNPCAVIGAFWREEYAGESHSLAGRLRAATRAGYYLGRPLIPRPVQLRLRRRFSAIQKRTEFPGWPAELSLHDLYDFLFEALAGICTEPVPRLAEWPHGTTWSLVLTHDVETAAGYGFVESVTPVERELGYRSSWNFVPERDYRVDADLLERLRQDGFEVGLHGLRHDGRDVAPERSFVRRLPAMQAHAKRWGATGFRSPATHREWSRISRLGLDHDSSYTDTARYEPQPGGCCSWLPFMIGDVVELPITLPQDHTVFELLGHADERIWLDKADLIRSRSGMALVLTHPDYMTHGPVFPAYERLLAAYADDPSAWKALPSEVSAWWRRRAASTIERRPDGTWGIDGPAAGDGRVQLGAGRDAGDKPASPAGAP